MNILKKVLVILVLVCTCFLFVGCKKEEEIKDDIIPINKEEQIKVGILQLVTHGALDAAREGFVVGLKDAGFEDGKNIKITVKN